MSIFRFRKNGKSTEQKPKTPKTVQNMKIECCKCGFSFYQPYINEKDLEKSLEKNNWTRNEDGSRICPRCNALAKQGQNND